jgi:hypothetical protein
MYSGFDNEYGYHFRLIGYIFCAFTLFKVAKYRIYDDLFKRALGRNKGSYIGLSSNPAANLLQGLFNVLLRAYFYVTVTFGCIYALMIGGSYSTADGILNIGETGRSGNVFVDLVYFSVVTISTVGYGDISPKATSAKLLCMCEILLGYFFIGMLLATILGRFNETED